MERANVLGGTTDATEGTLLRMTIKQNFKLHVFFLGLISMLACLLCLLSIFIDNELTYLFLSILDAAGTTASGKI
jgi:hypothetical protein